MLHQAQYDHITVTLSLVQCEEKSLNNMKKILVLNNILHEKLGLIEDLLKEKNYAFDVLELTDKSLFPDPANYAAVVVLGGPDSANDQTVKMINEINFVRRVVELKIPYLGICLGMQVLVKAGGGKVMKNAVKEIGFFDSAGDPFVINLTPAGKKDILFKNLIDEFPVFQLHGETVELTEDMTLLGIGDSCLNQVVRVGENAYGIQCHFELTEKMFKKWLVEDDDLKEMDHKALKATFKELEEAYLATGRTLFSNFLSLLQ